MFNGRILRRPMARRQGYVFDDPTVAELDERNDKFVAALADKTLDNTVIVGSKLKIEIQTFVINQEAILLREI